MKFPKEDSFAFDDLCQKIPFHFLQIAGFECLNELWCNVNVAREQQRLTKLSGASWGWTVVFELVNLSKSSFQHHFT